MVGKPSELVQAVTLCLICERYLAGITGPGIATRYVMEVRGSNPAGGEIFHAHTDRP